MTSRTESAIADFLEQRSVAVVGVTHEEASVANAIHRKLKDAGYRVFAVNPTMTDFAGEHCYPSVRDIRERVDGVMIVTRPSITERVVDDCIALGIPRVWMHNMLGSRVRWGKGITRRTTSTSDAAVERARAAGLSVIAGDCPMQHIAPVDPWHRCVHAVAGLLGNRD